MRYQGDGARVYQNGDPDRYVEKYKGQKYPAVSGLKSKGSNQSNTNRNKMFYPRVTNHTPRRGASSNSCIIPVLCALGLIFVIWIAIIAYRTGAVEAQSNRSESSQGSESSESIPVTQEAEETEQTHEDTPSATETVAPTVDYKATEESLQSTRSAVQTEQSAATNSAQEAIYRATEVYINGLISDAQNERDNRQREANALTDSRLTQSALEASNAILQATEQAKIEQERTEAERAVIQKERDNRITLDKTIRIAIQILIGLSSVFLAVIIFIAFGWSRRILGDEARRTRKNQRDAARYEEKQELAEHLSYNMRELLYLLKRSAQYDPNGRDGIQIIPAGKMEEWSGEHWTEVTGLLEGRYAIIKVRGGANQGTKLKVGNLGNWIDAVERGQFFNPDPLKGIA